MKYIMYSVVLSSLTLNIFFSFLLHYTDNTWELLRKKTNSLEVGTIKVCIFYRKPSCHGIQIAVYMFCNCRLLNETLY